jgi:transglutaminase-like putative cysteine protease
MSTDTDRRPHRHVGCLLELEVHGPARLALQVAVAKCPDVAEQFSVAQNGREVLARELSAAHGGRLHLLEVGPGRVTIEYRASVAGGTSAAAVDDLETYEYLRPSRYIPSDRLGAFALSEFGDVRDDGAKLAAVTSWVRRRLSYEVGSSAATDDAVDTLLAGRGVCRDFAHLLVGLMRALDVPARVVAVYAPGITPMDFHAVAEVLVDGAWQVVDATGLAPRQALVRIATGRDAADTAFTSSYGAQVDLLASTVFAYVDGDLPIDDHSASMSLG